MQQFTLVADETRDITLTVQTVFIKGFTAVKCLLSRGIGVNADNNRPLAQGRGFVASWVIIYNTVIKSVIQGYILYRMLPRTGSRTANKQLCGVSWMADYQ